MRRLDPFVPDRNRSNPAVHVEKTASDMTDSDLVRAADKGERDAFEELYLRHRNWVYSLARKICGNDGDAADVLQDTFFYFFNKFPGFELSCQLRTFLYPVISHLALARVKKAARTTNLDEAEVAAIPAGEIRDEGRERQELAGILAGLPELHREIVLLRFADGLELQEMADKLDVPVGTVKSRLHNAMTALRENLRSRKRV